MKITQDVRDYAARHNLEDADALARQGMDEKSRQFRDAGSELYVPRD